MSKGRKSYPCPQCHTPFFETVPACPVCGHQFYRVTEEPGWEIWTDWITSPVETTRRAVRSGWTTAAGHSWFLALLLTLLGFIIEPILLLPVKSLAFSMPIIKSGFVTAGLFTLISVLILLSLLAGLSVKSRSATLPALARVLVTAAVPWTFGMLGMILFKVIQLRGTTFPDPVFDGITGFFQVLSVGAGSVGVLIAMVTGIHTITGLSGWKLVFYSVGFPVIMVGLVLVILVLFAAGIFLG